MRGQFIKKQISDIENTKVKLDHKEEDITELKKQLKLKVWHSKVM